jgi:hypothetical protein
MKKRLCQNSENINELDAAAILIKVCSRFRVSPSCPSSCLQSKLSRHRVLIATCVILAIVSGREREK